MIEYFLLVCIYIHLHVDCNGMDYILVASLGHGLCNINLALKENNSRLFCYRLISHKMKHKHKIRHLQDIFVFIVLLGIFTGSEYLKTLVQSHKQNRV